MFWNKKDDKSGLPELPPLSPDLTSEHLPEPEDFDSSKKEVHPLPSFPDSPSQKEFPQTAIKEAISPPEIREIEAEEPVASSPPAQTMKFDKSPNIFIKIDKFNATRKALVSAQQKISEIDKMLKKIREARMREEQELTAWEKEVENAKARIEEASKNLFDKLS